MNDCSGIFVRSIFDTEFIQKKAVSGSDVFAVIIHSNAAPRSFFGERDFVGFYPAPVSVCD